MKKLYCTGITASGETKQFEVINGVAYCYNNQLTSLVVPEGVERLYCSENQLTSLVVPEGVERLYCSENQLTSLVVPGGVARLYCYNNQLTSLILPEGVKTLDCSHNQFVNNETTFINPKTSRVVFYQHGLYYCGCFCGKTAEELKTTCEEQGFIEVIQHFKL